MCFTVFFSSIISVIQNLHVILITDFLLENMDSCNRKKPPSAPKRTNSRKIMQNYKPQIQEKIQGKSSEYSEVETCADTLHNTATDFLDFLDRLEEVKATGNSQDLLKFIATDGGVGARKKRNSNLGHPSRVREKQHMFQEGGIPIKKTQSFGARRSLPAENKRERSKTQAPLKIIEETKNKIVDSKARIAAKRERSKTTTPIKSAKIFNVDESKGMKLVLNEDKANYSKDEPIDMKVKSSLKEKQLIGNKLTPKDKFSSAIIKKSQKEQKSCVSKISPRNSTNLKHRSRTYKIGSKCLKSNDEICKLNINSESIKVENSYSKEVLTENIEVESNLSENTEVSNKKCVDSEVKNSGSLLETFSTLNNTTEEKLDSLCINKSELEHVNNLEQLKNDNGTFFSRKNTTETSSTSLSSPESPISSLVGNKNETILLKNNLCMNSLGCSSEQIFDEIKEKSTTDSFVITSEGLDNKCDQKPLSNDENCKEIEKVHNRLSANITLNNFSDSVSSEISGNHEFQSVDIQGSCEKCMANRSFYQNETKVKSTNINSSSDIHVPLKASKKPIVETSSEVLVCDNDSFKKVNEHVLTNSVSNNRLDENKISSKVVDNDNVLTHVCHNNNKSCKTKTNTFNKAKNNTYNNNLTTHVNDYTSYEFTTKMHEDKNCVTTQKIDSKKVNPTTVNSFNITVNAKETNNKSIKFVTKPQIPPKPKVGIKPKLNPKPKLAQKPKIPFKPKTLITNHPSLEKEQTNICNRVETSSFVEIFSTTKDNCNIKNDEQVICGSKTEKTSLLSSFSNVNDSLKNNDESSFNSTFNFEDKCNQIDSVGSFN